MINAMIDLETLSTRYDAAIISIGAAIFDDEKVIDSNGWALDPRHVHGHMDAKTIFWWASQSDSARQFSFNGQYSDLTAAFELKTLFAKYNVSEVWSKDPHFDHVILEEWWRRLGGKAGEFPVHYRAPRAYRTLESETIALGFDKELWAQYNYVAHNPVDDAVTQARAVIQMRKLIRGGRQ